jgi:hypothetical protein
MVWAQSTMGVTMTNSVRRWTAGVVLASGAVTAAMIGAAGTPVACADDGSLATDIGLLNSAEANTINGFDVWTQAHGEPPPSLDALTEFITHTEAIQTPLLSSDNSLLSGLGEFLFNGPDQQLAHISDAFLSAAEAYAADPSTANGFDAASESLQFDDSMLSYSLPTNVIGEIVDQVLHIGGFDPAAGAAADAATSASSAVLTPDEVIGQAITELNQGNVVLDAASTADLSTRQAHILATQQGFSTQADPLLNHLDSLQHMLPAADQNFLGGVDEQLVTAAQNVVSADQAFVAADQAGELSSNSFLPIDLTLLEADLGVPGAAIYADFASLFALFDPGIATLTAASASAVADTAPAAAIDPSIFADLLSSIGL